MNALALILLCSGDRGPLGNPVPLGQALSQRAKSEVQGIAPFVISDDGTAAFRTDGPYGPYAKALRLSSLERVITDYSPTYYIAVLRGSMRAIAYTNGQLVSAGRRPDEPPYAEGKEVHTWHGIVGMIAAQSASTWLDARELTGSINNRRHSWLVVSVMRDAFGPGFHNLSGLISTEPFCSATSAVFQADGSAIVGIQHSYPPLIREAREYRLDAHGRLAKWRVRDWHRFKPARKGTFLNSAQDGNMAIDPLSGRSAVPTAGGVVEWNPATRRETYRKGPTGSRFLRLEYKQGRLMLQAGIPTHWDAKAMSYMWSDTERTINLYEASGAGWTEIGPYYIHGLSANGEYAVVRNVREGTWWLFRGRPSDVRRELAFGARRL